MKQFVLILAFHFIFTVSSQFGLSAQIKQNNADIVKLKWINFSPYTQPSQNPNLQTIVPETQISTLLDSLKPWVLGIRTFGTTDGLENVPYLAKLRGLKVIVGIWLNGNALTNAAQIASGIKIAKEGYADKLIVGCEVLRRGELSAAKVIEYINEVKLACPNIPVSYADITSELLEHKEVLKVCDFVSANIYPFWEGVPIECAMQSFHLAYQSINNVAAGKAIFIAESGWKTIGPMQGNAEPKLKNAIRYNRELLVWSKVFGVDVNIFTAFDEPWKLPNDYGWGIFNNDATLKSGMKAIFASIEKIDSTWLNRNLNNGNTDTIKFNFIPQIGSQSDLKGQINFVKPSEFRIASYIKVNGGWWTKPYLNSPTVPILCNGNWSVDITTGGIDQWASDIAVFLVPTNYTPPLCSNSGAIPKEIYGNAISWRFTKRCPTPYKPITVSPEVLCAGDTSILSATGGISYYWNTEDTTSSVHVVPTTTSEYNVMVSTASGCVETRFATVKVNPRSTETNLTKSICQGENYKGHTTTGTYIEYLKSIYGCDSIVTTILTVYPNLLGKTPTSNAANQISQSSFWANWNADFSILGFRMDVAADIEFKNFIDGFNDKDVGNVTTFKVSGLKNLTPYYFRVRAYNSCGTSTSSNIITAITLPNPPAAPIANIATNPIQTSFNANWNNSATATGYRLDIATNIGFTTFVASFNDKDVGNVVTYAITGLSANTTYYYRVRAYNTGGTGVSSNTITVKTLPNPPVAPSANAATNLLQTSFNANWNNAANATGYRVDIATNIGFTTFVAGFNDKDVGIAVTYTISGLSAFTPYYYRVRAYNTGGTGLSSNIVTVNTLPNPPAAPIANTATNLLQTSFNANWNSSATATSYRLDIATNIGFTTFVAGFNDKDVGNAVTYAISGLSANTPYYYRVRAYNTGGTGLSSNTITITTLPNPPTALIANAATNPLQTSFNANWNNSATATGYRLDIATNIGFTTFVAGFNDKDVGNVVTYAITGLSANTTYYYRVRAYNTGGTGVSSNTITVKTLPNPPTAPIANPTTNPLQTSFSTNWNNSATATGYRLDIATNIEFTSFVAGFNDKDVGNVVTYAITGLSANTTYYYRVRAYNTGGTGLSSNIIANTTLPNPPAAPITNTATNILQTSFNANWNNSETAIGYRIDVATNIGFTSFVAGHNDKDIGNVTSYNVAGLSAHSTYYFRVRAYNTGGTGVTSNSITVTTLSNPPATPTGLVATSCNNLVTLKWRKNADPYFLRYRIYGGIVNNPTVKVDSSSVSISDTSKVISGLSNGQTYYFRVTAVNNDGPESVFSGQTSAVVKTGFIPVINAKWGDLLICYNLDNLISNYQWYKGSSLIPNAISQYYSAGKQAGNYLVVTIDKDGCKNSSNTIQITASTKSLTVYPNPATVSFALKLIDTSELKEASEEPSIVSLINSSGQKVLEFQAKNTNDELLKAIPVNNLANGVYIIQVMVNQNELYYTKIVVLK